MRWLSRILRELRAVLGLVKRRAGIPPEPARGEQPPPPVRLEMEPGFRPEDDWREFDLSAGPPRCDGDLVRTPVVADPDRAALEAFEAEPPKPTVPGSIRARAKSSRPPPRSS